MERVLDLIKNKVMAERIKNVFGHKKRNSRLFQYWNLKVNCCGALAYGLRVTEEMRKLSPRKFLYDFELPNPVDCFPGYVPPRAGMEFLRKRCDDITAPEEGDIVIFWETRGWSHSGIYLGNFNGRRVMYNKDGIESDFSLSDIDRYFRVSGLDDFSFHRQRNENGSAGLENKVF